MKRKFVFLFALAMSAGSLSACATDEDSALAGVHAFEAEDYSLAREELEPLASRGNPIAQFYIAKMHHLGLGVNENFDLAFSGYSDSAEQGYAKAQHNFGYMHVTGIAPNSNPQLGYEWISKAADQGLPEAQFMMGVALSFTGSPLKIDKARGLQYFRAAASQNHAPALTKLGDHYTTKVADHEKAGKYYDQAVALGDPEAMHRLSFAYMNGTLRPADKEKAHDLLKTAAEKKWLPSYYDLAMSYLWGNGVQQNVEEGVSWLRKSAADANDARAMESLAQIQLEQREHFSRQVQDLGSIEAGVELRKKAAEMNYALAQRNLFVQYYTGAHVPEDKIKAIEWLEASASNGDLDAQYELAMQYWQGWHIERDQDRAISLYEKAADGGHRKAALTLGAMYAMGVDYPGLNVEQNSAEALYWLNKGDDNEGVSALSYAFAYLYGGNGVLIDRELAMTYLKKARADAALANAALFMIPMVYWDEEYGPRDVDRSIDLALEVEPLLNAEEKALIQLHLSSVYAAEDDFAEAVFWAEKAAESDDVRALSFAGQLMVSGDTSARDFRKGWNLLIQAATRGDVDAQYLLGSVYALGSEEAGLGNKGVAINIPSAKHWLSLAVGQDDKRAGEFLTALEQEIKAKEEEAARKQERLAQARQAELFRREEIRRLEQADKFERARQEKIALEREIAEYRRREKEQQARWDKQPTFGERLIGGFFEVLGEGIGLAVTAKINKELGIKTSEQRRLDERRNVAEDANDRLRRQLQQDERMRQIMKNLQNTTKIGCESYGC